MSTYDDASLIMYPSGYKEDKIYSLKPTDGSGDLDFTRASTATRVNAEGLIETSPVNLLQYSEEFNVSPWVLDTGGGTGSITVTNNYATAPNGTLTADRIQMVMGTVYAQTFQALPVISGAEYTLSVYLKSLSGTPTISTIVGANVSSQKTLTTEWVKYELTFNATSSTIYPLIALYGGDSATADILAWGYQINIGSTAKPYFPTTDRLNVPRIDYTGGGCGSLLLEKQSTNLYTYSDQLNQWTASSATVTANYATSPDGTTNADRVQFTSGGLLYRSGTGSAGENTISVYAKATNGVSAKFRFFSNGTVTNSSDLTATGEWKRFTFTYTFSAVTAGIRVATTGADDIIFYGFQHELGSYPTSYIPTLASSVTRLADSASKTGISSLIGQTQGTMFVEFIAKGSYDSNNLLMLISTGSGGEIIYLNLVNGIIEAYIAASATQQFLYNGATALSANTRHKLAIGYANNDVVLYHNGTQLATDTSATIPACTLLRVGNFLGGIYQFGNTINQAILFKTRLTNDQLADLTGGNKTTFNSLATFYGYTIL